MINNFRLAAYNNGMEEIEITQNGYDGAYMSYLYKRLKERFSFLPSTCEMEKSEDCIRMRFKTERAYCPYVRRFAEENVADVLTVGYKYRFFDRQLKLPLLKEREKRLLLTALVAADYKEDKGYVMRRLRGNGAYCLDGVYHFRLRELKKRWEEIANYVPTDMGEASLEQFLVFLVEDGEGKVFVKGGKVYDEEYRVLSKSSLTGACSPVGEIMLFGAQKVYCFGETDGETSSFLKKYYGEKATFC